MRLHQTSVKLKTRLVSVFMSLLDFTSSRCFSLASDSMVLYRHIDTSDFGEIDRSFGALLLSHRLLSLDICALQIRSTSSLVNMATTVPDHFTGSCLCGAVVFTITSAPTFRYLCHCGSCKKTSGSSFMHNWNFPDDVKVPTVVYASLQIMVTD